ncbi:tetratricopeptide repeat protein [Roseicella aquatilis]|uniref:Tetratricopeptide repeat protein n=1 Tax=Roseicella aquatilis TaxID=2527868 RepID=A0A4R4DFW3_9PROT|nr:tetratricopeptide repeat protein [Roseicella aquatilis]TCZ59859.1 tetratricopeptide repeat protein [Roseicella aquatilis]
MNTSLTATGRKLRQATMLAAALVLLSHPARAAEEALPLPPDIARIADGPQYDECLDLLQQDADDALAFAENWEAGGGGEGAKHCAALALLGLGEAQKAAERLEALARTSRAAPAARAQVFSQAVQAWIAAQQPGRAFAAATMGLTLAPDDLDLMVDRSMVLGSMGRYREALEDLDRVLQADQNLADAWVLRAAALRHLDRIAPAIAAVERALALAPDHAEALLERGIIRQMRGDTAGARADWEQAIRVAPDSPAADLAQQNLALNEAGPSRR